MKEQSIVNIQEDFTFQYPHPPAAVSYTHLVFGDAIDLQRFAEIGKKGVLALMSDSTNAERKGFTQSEKTVGITFDHIFAEHQNTRLIIATFASNVDRVQQIINSAYKYGRKVCLLYTSRCV